MLFVYRYHPNGLTASQLARQVRVLSNQGESEYGAAAPTIDLKKLRGKEIVRRIGQTRRYQSTSSGLKAMVALVVLRNKAIKPFVSRRAGSTPITRRAESQTARSELRNHSYGHASRLPGTGAGSLNIDNNFFKLRH